MKLESFGISNFKAFGHELQRLPLKPITLIFGQNSAGKSSALHSALWLHHVLTTGKLNVRFPERGNGQVDLGGYTQTLHHHDPTRRIVVELIFPEEDLPESIRSFWCIDREVSLDLSFGRVPGSDIPVNGLVDYRLRIDGFDFLTAIRNPEGLSIGTLALGHTAIEERIGQLASKAVEPGRPILQMSDLEGLSADELADKFAASHREMTEADQALESLGNKIAREYVLECKGLLPSGVSIRNTVFNDDFWDLILPKRLNELVSTLSMGAMTALENLRYVPPLRELPPRYFDLNESDAIWQRLFEERAVADRVNTWFASSAFETKYELVVSEYFARTALEREAPSLIRSEIAQVALSSPTGRDTFAEELDLVVSELQEKYGRDDIESFLRSQPDLFETVIDRDVDYVRDDDCFPVPHPSGKSPQELSDEEIREHLEPHLNWEAWVGIDALKSGDVDAIELFQRWAADQPLLLELFDRHGDTSLASARFLRGKRFGEHEVRREILLRHKQTKTEVSLQEVGVGISQVLPVILNAFGERNKLIAIEQPEIHIHPALQAELGDVFIESALGENKNTFLLETHSEHLILRIMRRIRETSEGEINDWPDALREACPNGIRPEDVAVLYVQPGEDGAEVIELPVDANGEFTCDWPGGFFEERMKELFS
jgi:hypothetical protein